MKKFLFIAAAFIISAGAIAQTGKPDDVAKFNSEKHDFGKVKQAVPAIYYFEITNKSDKPLVIESATATCGCTVPEYPKEPILPGKTSKLKVEYNAVQGGHFDKQVYIKFAGFTEQKVLGITGEVLPAEAYEAWVKENASKSKSKNKSKQPSK